MIQSQTIVTSTNFWACTHVSLDQCVQTIALQTAKIAILPSQVNFYNFVTSIHLVIYFSSLLYVPLQCDFSLYQSSLFIHTCLHILHIFSIKLATIYQIYIVLLFIS